MTENPDTFSRLKIGILAPPGLIFSAWERRLLERIATDARFEIAAFIVDGRPPAQPRSALQRLQNGLWLQALMLRVTRRLDKNNISNDPEPVQTPVFDAVCRNATRISVQPERRRFVDYFLEPDCEPIRALGLDVILRHEFGIIKGAILDVAKHGIWSFHHADNRVNRGGPPGFWETFHNEPVTGATLQVLTPELDGGLVIARCWRNTQPNAVRNQQAIFELSNSLIWRELQRLARCGNVELQPSDLYDGPLYVAPKSHQLIAYCIKRIFNILNGVKFQILKRNHRRPNMWCLALGKGNIEYAALWRTKEIQTSHNRFWADPFLIKHDGTTYVFFEEYDYTEGRAWISAGIIQNEKFEYLGKVIDAGYHMSFPFIFEHEGAIYLIPETATQRRLEIWRATCFPMKWELHKTTLSGWDLADTVLHKHHGQWYMLTNMCNTMDSDFCNELHVFMIDSPDLNSVTPHPENPVVIDSRTARNGGRLFTRNGRLYRPSQNNSYGVYGYGLNIMEITELTPTTYREQLVRKAEPNFRPGITAIHHVDSIDDIFIIDTVRAVGGKGEPIKPVDLSGSADQTSTATPAVASSPPLTTSPSTA